MNRGIYLGLGLAVAACAASILLLVRQPAKQSPAQPEPPPPPAAEPVQTPEPTPVAAGPAYDRNEQLADAIAENPDVVGWLVVPGTDIDEPVPKTLNNDYYLNHNWKRQYDTWGSYFGDYINDFSHRDTLSHNNMIYGHSHNAEDWNLPGFTQLFHYNDIDFLRQHPCVYLYLADGDELVFQVVGAFYTDIWFDYINPEPALEPELDYYRVVKGKNEYLFDGIDFDENDVLLSLSTCSYKYDTKNRHNHRYVVLGKLLDPGQLPATVEVRRNPNAEHPDP